MSTSTNVLGLQSMNVKNKSSMFDNTSRRADMITSSYYEDCEKVDFGAIPLIYDDGLSIREEYIPNQLCPIVYNRHLIKSGGIQAKKWLKELKAKEEEEKVSQLYFIKIENPEEEYPDNLTFIPTTYNPLTGEDQLTPCTIDVLRFEFKKYISKHGKPNPKHWTLEKYISSTEKGEIDNWDEDLATAYLDPEKDFQKGLESLRDEEADEIGVLNREIEKDFLPEHLVKKNWRAQLSKDGTPEGKLFRDVIYFRDYKTFQVRVSMDELCKVLKGKDRSIWNTWMLKNPGVLSDKYYTFSFQTQEDKDKAVRWFEKRYFDYQTGGKLSLAKVKWIIHQRAFLGVYGYIRYNSPEWKNLMNKVEAIYEGSDLL